MYRVLFPEGQIECERYERTEFGVELFNADDQFMAFVPYANLHAVVDDDHAMEEPGEPSVM